MIFLFPDKTGHMISVEPGYFFMNVAGSCDSFPQVERVSTPTTAAPLSLPDDLARTRCACWTH